MRSLLAAVAAASLSALTACCEGYTAPPQANVAQVPSARFSATYAPLGDGTFQANALVDVDGCIQVGEATAEVGGVTMGSETSGVACGCESSQYGVDGAPIPPVTDGVFRVVDGSGEMTATVPQLFVEPTVALRAPATALQVGTRVYLDFLPDNGTLVDVTVSFTPTGAGVASFTRNSSDGSLGHDASGYYLDVPNVAAGDGELTASTFALLTTSSCVGAWACEVTGTATRRLATAVVP